MPYPSGREVGRSLFGRVPSRLRSRLWTSNAAEHAHREGSSSRLRARLGSARHLPVRKSSGTLRSVPWRIHPAQPSRIWYPVPGTTARESPNHVFCSKNERSFVPPQRSDSFSRPRAMICETSSFARTSPERVLRASSRATGSSPALKSQAGKRMPSRIQVGVDVMRD